MSPNSASPILHEYALMEDLRISPELLEDQDLEFPSFKDILKWIIGKKKISLTIRKGFDAKKVDLWLAILNAKRIQREEESEKLNNELKKVG